jgi:hypothetical protein
MTCGSVKIAGLDPWLGRRAQRLCQRGDLGSQRGGEPNTHDRSSFEDNEG